jgi:hypothetical protein
MKPNRQVETLLAQPFMRDTEEGPEPYYSRREMAWELLMDLMNQLTRQSREDHPELPGEVAELIGVCAVADFVSGLTRPEALRRATSRKSLKLMAAKVELESALQRARDERKLIRFGPRWLR